MSTQLTVVPPPDAAGANLDWYRAILKATTLFGSAHPDAVEDLAGRVSVLVVRAHSVVVTQGEPGDSLFFIGSGRAHVVLDGTDGRRVLLAQFAAGDWFGEMSVLDGGPRPATVIAVAESTLLTIAAPAFWAHLRLYPQTALSLLEALSRRLRTANDTIRNLALCEVEARLVHLFIRLAQERGDATAEGFVLREQPTQEAIASMVGACRETVSRTLTNMVRRGLLIRRGRTLVVTHGMLKGEIQPPSSAAACK